MKTRGCPLASFSAYLKSTNWFSCLQSTFRSSIHEARTSPCPWSTVQKICNLPKGDCRKGLFEYKENLRYWEDCISQCTLCLCANISFLYFDMWIHTSYTSYYMHLHGCMLWKVWRNLPLFPTQELASNENDQAPSLKNPDTQLPSQACLWVHSIVQSLFWPFERKNWINE